MLVNAKVPESMVDRIKPGQQVQIKLNAFPQETLAGVVQDVAPLPDPARPNSGAKFYTTMVLIEKGLPVVTAEGPDRGASRHARRLLRGLRPGFTAQVEILVKELDDVISVPIGALLRIEARPCGGEDQGARRRLRIARGDPGGWQRDRSWSSRGSRAVMS